MGHMFARLWPALLALAAGLALACALLATLAGWLAGGDELGAARERWASRPLARYRLVVSEETSAGGCRQDVRVQNERIVAVLQNQCVRVASWTVSNLFAWAAGLDRRSTRCYPTDVTCVCHAIYSAEARYDPQLGYPRQITYQWRLETNWAYAGHWERMVRAHELPNCVSVARRVGGYISVTVLSLTPEP